MNWIKGNWLKIWIAFIIGIVGLAIFYNQLYLATKKQNLDVLREGRIAEQTWNSAFEENKESYIETVMEQRGFLGKLFFK